MAEESTKPPKVFISYAWEDDTKIWVRELATRLRKNGVYAILDQWDVAPGDSLPEFMEGSVSASDFVLVVCTPAYKSKSDSSDPSGVGYEKGVITGELFVKRNQRKFIPVLRKRKWLEAAPSWVLGKTYIDLRGKPYSENSYQELLRTLYGKRKPPPELGTPPDFSDDDDSPEKPKSFAEFFATLTETLSETFTRLKSTLPKAIPFVRTIGFIGIGIALLWGGSLAIPKFIALIPTAKASVAPPTNTKIAFTKTPVSATMTLRPNVTPTKTRTPVPTSLPSQITDTKGVSMVLVPAGKFSMGSENGDSDESPVHTVYLDDFYMDVYEVTNALYKACVTANVCDPPYETYSDAHSRYYGNLEFDDYPVIYVAWNQAKTYCEWRNARLPTEAEWEKAARGTDERTYPWGEGIKCSYANYGGCTGNDTTKVGSYEGEKSPYDIYDLSGNVWEWVNDWYNVEYYKNSRDENPLGPASGQTRVIRGGSWRDFDFDVRSANRSDLDPVLLRLHLLVGFRCAKDATP